MPINDYFLFNKMKLIKKWKNLFLAGMVRYAKTQLSVSCLTIKFVSCFIVDRVVFFGKISCFLREFSSLIFDFLRPFESLFRFILVKIP